MYSKEEIAKYLKESVEWLIEEDMGCTTLKLDDRLGICVGWLPEYGEEHRDDCIQSKEEPDFAINAGIKVYTSDDLGTDYEFINMPYYENGDVVQTDVSISPDEDYDELAEYFLKEYEGLKDLDIEEDGLIVEHKEEVEESKKKDNATEVDNFLKDAIILLVDDARTFDIDKEDVKESIEDGSTSEEKSEKPEFIKHSLDNETVSKIVDKLKTISASDVTNGYEGKEHWKTKQFKKIFNLTDEDLVKIINSLDVSDYNYNSTPTDDDRSEAIIFVKKDNISVDGKEVGPIELYIKLDYASVSECPVIIISFHTDKKGNKLGKKASGESLKEDVNDFKTLANELYDHLSELGVYYEIWPEENGISIEITWGDWKHDHLWCDYEVKNFLNSKGHEIVSYDTELTDEDGGDTYSAIHSYIIK